MAYTPNRVIRVAERTWDAFGQVCAAKGRTRSDYLRDLMEREIAKFVRDGGTILPPKGNQATHDDTSGSPR